MVCKFREWCEYKDGEKVKVASRADPSRYYIMNSLDVLVLPASLGAYTLENLGVGSVTVHKTLLKEPPEEKA